MIFKILHNIDIFFSRLTFTAILILIQFSRKVLGKEAKSGKLYQKFHALSQNRYIGLISLYTERNNRWIHFGNHKLFVPHYKSFRYGFYEIFIDGEYFIQKTDQEINIIDCGCHIGLSILYFKDRAPNAYIQAYEADPENFKSSQKNIESFNLSNVQVFNQAVWINDGGISFSNLGGHSGKVDMSTHQALEQKSTINIPSMRLRDALKNKPIDILKIDIEGAEREVMEDIKNNLQDVKLIFIEIHQKVGDNWMTNVINYLALSQFDYLVKEAKTHEYGIEELNPNLLNQLMLLGKRRIS